MAFLLRRRSSRLVIHVPTTSRNAPGEWFLAGRINPANCIGAYESLLAGSLADSYINLANPGTYDLTTTAAPTYTGMGWKGGSKLLDTGIVPAQNWSLFTWFFTGSAAVGHFLCGAYTNPTRFSLVPSITSKVEYGSGSFLQVSPGLAQGSLAVAGQQGYRNGITDGAAIEASWGTPITSTVNILKLGGYADYFGGYVQRFALYDTVLTPSQVLKIHSHRAPLEAIFLGDSITWGSSASNAAHQYVNLICADRGWNNFRNSGISGITLQNTVQTSVPISGAAAELNIRDRFTYEWGWFSANYVFILAGLNDLRLNDAAFSVANYQNDLGEIVDIITASGVPAGHVVIGSPTYMNPDIYADYAPWNGGSTEKHEDYTAAAAAVAAAKGTLYKDIYQYMLDNGDDSLLAVDGIHANDAGHAAIAAAFLELF